MHQKLFVGWMVLVSNESDGYTPHRVILRQWFYFVVICNFEGNIENDKT